jgi:hypothetical protein
LLHESNQCCGKFQDPRINMFIRIGCVMTVDTKKGYLVSVDENRHKK